MTIHEIDLARLSALPGTERNELMMWMHAHNELSFVNRLLMFSMNEPTSGIVGEQVHSVQMWSVMQLLAGKLLEIWDFVRGTATSPTMLAKFQPNERSAVSQMDKVYLPQHNRSQCPLHVVRNNTAFHYGRLNLDASPARMAEGENVIYLTQSPANRLFFVGSAAVFRSLLAKIADDTPGNPSRGRPFDERVLAGNALLMEHLKEANWHLTIVLNALIQERLVAAFGEDYEWPSQATTVSPTDRNEVVLPAWIS